MAVINDLDPTSAAPPRMSIGKGLLILCAVVAVVAALIFLSMQLGIKEAYAGFFFFLFWAGIEQANTKKLPGAIIGAFAGLGLGFLIQQSSQLFGDPKVAQFLPIGLILLAIYCQVMGWVPWLVNNATMLMLTVSTITHVQAHADFIDMFKSLTLAVVYLSVLVFGGKYLFGMLSKK